MVPPAKGLSRRAAPAVAAMLVSLCSTAGAAPGDLDPTFGTAGIGESILSSFDLQSADVAIQPDGKIVVVTGRNDPLELVVARYDPSGALDPTWGGTGEVVTSVAPGSNRAISVVVQPDGKVLVAVSASLVYVARFDPSGAPDPTWGSGGVVATPLDNLALPFVLGHALRVQPDGRVLVGGRFGSELAVARYSPGGVLDPSFGGTGVATATVGGDFRSMALQGDGRVLVVATVNGRVRVVRFLGAGTLDLGFGTGGIYTAPNLGTGADDDARDVVAHVDGTILVGFNDGETAGLANTQAGILRLLPNGVPDPAWNGTGVVVSAVATPPGLVNLHTVLPQGDGKILAVGGASHPGPLLPVHVVAWRYLPDGTLDGTWGTGGVAFADIGSAISYGSDAALQSDSKLVVPGFALIDPIVAPVRFEVGEFCGDGVAQASEECDDGNVLGGDCCSAACLFEAAGSACPDDGAACTSDACDAAGTCVHVPLAEGASCEDGNVCTTGETCTGGVCGGGIPGAGGTCLNPYVCYNSSPSKGHPSFGGADDLSLIDDLEAGSFDAKSQFEICVPAEVNELPVQDPLSRQIAYKIKKSPGEPKHVKQNGIVVQDLFGLHTFDTKKPELLLVPAGLSLLGPTAPPSPTTANHYKCYKVRQSKGTPRFSQAKVTATDEFEDRFYDVYEPRRLCFAVDKNGEGIVDPTALLTCYRLRRAAGQPVHERLEDLIHTADQFGALRLDTKKERDLCVPATLVP